MSAQNGEKHPDDKPKELTPLLRTKIELAVKRYQAARTAYYESHGAENERRALRDAAEEIERAEYVEALLTQVESCEKEMGIRGDCVGGLLEWMGSYTEAIDAGMTERAKRLLSEGRQLLLAALEEETEEWEETKRGQSE